MTHVGPVSRPLVSILIPSYNQGPYLADALDSTLAQDYRPLEVIVMDGGSTDETVPILKDFAARHPELRWWSEPDEGVADAVNKALARASGVYAGIQSSDDIYLPGAVSCAVRHLEANPQLGAVYGDGAAMDAAGKSILWHTAYPPFSMRTFLLGATVPLQSSTFFRLDIARDIGGWRKACYVADLDLWLRMSFVTEFAKIDQQFSVWRVHPDQRNQRTRAIWDSYWQMFDDCAPLRDAPASWRRAAHASRRLFTRYYNPTGSHWYLRYQLWRAIAAYPPAVRMIKDKTILLPGLARAQQLFGRGNGTDDSDGDPSPALDLRWWASGEAR